MNNLILHINCPDQRGIIAQITDVIYKYDANVLDLEQHVEPDQKHFFMRLYIDTSNVSSSIEALNIDLKKKINEMDAKINFYYPEKLQKISIFVTKESAPLYDLLIKHQSGELKCSISCIISNHQVLEGIAQKFNMPFFYIPLLNKTKVEHELAIQNILEKENIDLIVLARYMQILSADFVSKYYGKIINIHHGFLPAFKGRSPYRQAWERGVKMIGATAHYVTKDLDEGPIIAQDAISITHQYTINEMIKSGRDIERRVLLSAVKAHLQYRIMMDGKKTIIFHS